MSATPGRRLAAWGVHLFTASGAPVGVLAILAAVRGDAKTALFCMAYTLFVDALDGTLARILDVKHVVPTVDGTRLDDIVDYSTYVIVPAVFLVSMGMLPTAATVPVLALMTMSSAIGFARTDAKTTDHFFTGFPSYWNITAFYLYVLDWSPTANAILLTVLSVLVFVPIRYVYPSRTPTLRRLTLGLGCLWTALGLWVLGTLDAPTPAVVYASLAFPAYYVGLSLVLEIRRLS